MEMRKLSALLVISIGQFLILIFLVIKMLDTQDVSVLENKISTKENKIFEEVSARKSECSILSIDLPNLAKKLSLELMKNDQLKKSISSSISADLNKLLETYALRKGETNNNKELVENESLSEDELMQRAENFIASGDISIARMNDFYRQLGPLNINQRKKMRRLIAKSINSGDANLIP